MAITIPSELAWVLQMLGYEWPEVDEDEVQKGAVLLRQFGEDMDTAIQQADAIIQDQIGPAYKANAGEAFVAAWDEDKSANIQGYIALLDPAASGMDLLADAVVALKLKVIAELVITAAQIAAAVASAAFTLGLGAAANVALIAARKKAMDFLTNVAVDQAMQKIFELLTDPLTSLGAQLTQAIEDAPVVQGALAERAEFEADMAALEAATDDLEANAADQERLVDDFVTQFASLEFSTAG